MIVGSYLCVSIKENLLPLLFIVKAPKILHLCQKICKDFFRTKRNLKNRGGGAFSRLVLCPSSQPMFTVIIVDRIYRGNLFLLPPPHPVTLATTVQL